MTRWQRLVGTTMLWMPVAASAHAAGVAQQNQTAASVAPDASSTALAGPAGRKPARPTARRDAAQAVSQDASTVGVGENIIVVAQKRKQRLLDVPDSVTHIDAESLIRQNLSSLRDYYTRVPGLTFTGGAGESTIAIRGIISDATGNPTVGVTVDDVPVGASSSNAVGGELIPDLDPAILKDIEVLRGPQGTLYGAASIGGLLRYETTTPDSDHFFGQVQSGGSGVDGGGLGWIQRLSMNVPLITDTLAMSITGFDRRTPGYIDYPNLLSGPKSSANDIDAYGGRIALAYTPIERVKLLFSMLDEEKQGHGSNITLNNEMQPLVNDHTDSTDEVLADYTTTNRLYTGRAEVDLGFANLTSVTGYGQTRYDSSSDLTYLFSDLFGELNEALGLPVANDRAILRQIYQTDKFSQEVRLSSRTGSRLEWLLGGFYTYERSDAVQRLAALDPGTLESTEILDGVSPSTFREEAVFADATYHFTKALSLQGGLRYAVNQQTYSSISSGPLTELEGDGATTGVSDDSAVTWMVTPEYKITRDLMAYARIATGYRPGGPNSALTPEHLTYNPDTTINYEVGLKGDLLRHRLSFAADLFWIDWKNIQLSEIDSVTNESFIGNGGRARSRGAEAEVSYRVWQGGIVAANAAFTDATLLDSLDGETVGNAGDRLPLSARWTTNLSFDQTIPLNPRVDATFGGTLTYVGRRFGVFVDEGDTRGVLPSYVSGDLRAGLEIRNLSLDFYVRNIANQYALISISTSGSPYTAGIIQPRTFGGQLTYKF